MPPIKQYVNLPAGATSAEGPSRDLRVTPNSVPNVGPGDKIEWWIEPAAGNVDSQYIPRPSRAKLRFAETALGGSGAFENQIKLPHVGGDKYVVKVAKKGDGVTSLSTDELETWRKIYYTMFHVGPAALTMFNSLEARFKAAFAEGFIELANVAKVAALTQLARVDLTTTAGLGRPALHFLGGGANGIINLRPTGTGTLANKPFHAAILVVPDIYRLEERPRVHTNQRAVTGTTDVPFRLFRDAGNPQAFAYRAQVRWTGQPGVDVRSRLSLVGAPTDHLSRFQWDLGAVPGLTTWLGTPANTYTLDLVLVRESTVMGYSLGNLCVVRTVDGLTDVLQTFTHELGHGVGQVVHWEQRWDAAGAALASEANPKRHFDEYGGRGSHCTTNARLAAAPASAGLTTGQWYVHDSGRLCTMFWRGDSHVDPDGKFCGHCKPRMRRADLDSASMQGRHWNYIG